METILSHHNSISKAHTQKDTLYNYLRPKLVFALVRGEISPFELAIIDSWKASVVSKWENPSYGFLSSSLTEEEMDKANKLRSQIGLRSIETRNRLIAIQEETGMNFYLPGWPEANGKIEVVKQQGLGK